VKLCDLQNQKQWPVVMERGNVMPADEVGREALKVEPPVVAVVRGADLA
jgi:hypothetical protein